MSHVYLVPAPHLTHGVHLANSGHCCYSSIFWPVPILCPDSSDSGQRIQLPERECRVSVWAPACLQTDTYLSILKPFALFPHLRGPEWISPALLSPRALNASWSNPVMWITGIQLFPKCLPLCEAQNSSRKTELSLSTGTDPFYSARKAFFFLWQSIST